jgi:hypothetical protein
MSSGDGQMARNVLAITENTGKRASQTMPFIWWGLGEHAVMLNVDGEYVDDIQACNRPRVVGIYILPMDYLDRDKYPDCRTRNFTEVVPLPP